MRRHNNRLLETLVEVVGQRLIWLGIASEPIDSHSAANRIPALAQLSAGQETSRHLMLHALDGMVASFYEVKGGSLLSRIRRQTELSRPLVGFPGAVSMCSMSFITDDIDVLLVLIGLGDTPRSEVERCVREVAAGVQQATEI